MRRARSIRVRGRRARGTEATVVVEEQLGVVTPPAGAAGPPLPARLQERDLGREGSASFLVTRARRDGRAPGGQRTRTQAGLTPIWRPSKSYFTTSRLAERAAPMPTAQLPPRAIFSGASVSWTGSSEATSG